MGNGNKFPIMHTIKTTSSCPPKFNPGISQAAKFNKFPNAGKKTKITASIPKMAQIEMKI